ncbi:SixA phosphatase family protein [Limimaricola cinnabarinus]|uniref:SixA phosphatase family protein n=1 Tax=Limimaricola cinnabarinus TaxID=1125964 RepID=UPI002FE3C12A
MSLTLILIRHAKSDWADPGQPDHARPLAPRGRRDAPRMGAWLAHGGHLPELVLCSDAARTRETLQLMQPEWPTTPEIRHASALYAAPPRKLRGALEGMGARSIALVAHNPGIGQLAADLAAEAPAHPRFADYPTCAVTVLKFEANDWSSISKGRVAAFAIPADL